jgi:hypothetical protein
MTDDEKHYHHNVKIELGDLRHIWSDQPDKTRIEIIKSIIWTSISNRDFHAKVLKELQSQKFADTLD